MSTVRTRGEAIRTFIVSNLEEHPTDITRITSGKFGCTRQAVNKHIQHLITEGAIKPEGHTRRITYTLAPLASWKKTFTLSPDVTESRLWTDEMSPLLGSVLENVRRIWQYGFTEMLNNVIDHSGGKRVTIHFKKNAASTSIILRDTGVGIFKKIQGALGLLDERHAVLELAKGKFTTDPAHHSGEGIFFSSRMFDSFWIVSGEVYFSHNHKEPVDWILLNDRFKTGTMVGMELNNHSSRSTRKVFDKFSSGADYGFTKTVIPVKLLQYGDDQLISRSQARRLLARFDRFKTVILDFTGVTDIGQAFADEVFRVFAQEHPNVEIVPLRANSDVKKMILRALGQSVSPLSSTEKLN